MKIIHIINSLSIGGAERLVIDTLKIQKSLGHEVIIFTLLNGCNEFEADLIRDGISVVKLNGKKFSLINILKLRKYIYKLKPDIIHSHLFPSQYVAAISSFGINRNLITTEHSSYNRRRHWLFGSIERLMYCRYKKIICISKKVESNLRDFIGLRIAKRIKLIPNGINLEIFSQVSDKFVMPDSLPNTIKLIMVSRFSPAKDHKTVIDSLAFLNDNIHLFFVGYGPLMEHYIDYVNLNSLDERVHFLGGRNDIPELISSSDILILSSNWEGFGLSVVEGMAMGKPIIVNNVDGLPELVQECGLVFERGNAEDLAIKIKLLINDKSLFNRLSLLSKIASKKFDVKQMVQKYIDLYVEVLEEH